MDRLRRLLSWSSSGHGGRWAVAMVATVAMVVALGGVSPAAADDCVALGGALNGGQCVISTTVGPKTGTFNLDETLHFTAGGTLNVAATGIVININAGDFLMDNGTLIDGNVIPGSCNTGAAITINIPAGNVDMDPGSIVRSNSCSGGFIQITTGQNGVVDIDGLVESVGSASGTGGSQRPGGGPITIKAGCGLTISDEGVVSSRGRDPGADLVHLEGCTVTINGLVESTGSGHIAPNFPANSCSNKPTLSVRRNPVTRPGKPVNSTGCVEIWSGTTLVIDSTGTHKGEVKADIGITGGSEGRGWIDLLANGTISILDGTGNDNGGTVFAVHANGSTQQNTDDGGLILIQSYNGDVIAVSNAVQADALTSGSKGGEIRIEARNNVTMNAASIFARGDFDAAGGFGSGGKIGPLASSIPPPPSQAPVRAFNGAISWINGVGDVRPTGSLVPAGQRGSINLQACTGVDTTGATFPVNGAVVPPFPNILAPACGGAPTVPAYVTGFPAANCDTFCTIPGGGRKSGVKFNDVDGDGVKDPGEPLLPGWRIRLYQGGVFVQEQTTDGAGFYEFNLLNGTYVVCEVLQAGWTQTLPNAATPGAVACPADPAVTLAPFGYEFTISDANPIHTNNDFGNHTDTPVCPEDPDAILTRVVDATGAAHGGLPVYTTVQAAYNASTNGDVIGIYSNTIENLVLNGDKTLTITQCTAARVTAAQSNQPVWKITSTGKLTIIGPDSAGGTVGWSLDTGGHELRGVRATGASLFGIQIGQNSNGNTVSFNSVTANGVGVQIDGDNNGVRGGTVSGNSGDGVVIGSNGSTNTFQGANVQNNGGNGIVVAGSSNTVKDNSRVDNNGLAGILVTGANNTVKNNQAGSDKGKGNGTDGIKITGTGSTVESNKTNANTGNGFWVTSTGTGTKLKSNQSNTTASGGNNENGGAEYKLDAAATNQGGNKADTIAIPKTTAPTKCPTFSAVSVCE